MLLKMTGIIIVGQSRFSLEFQKCLILSHSLCLPHVESWSDHLSNIVSSIYFLFPFYSLFPLRNVFLCVISAQ